MGYSEETNSNVKHMALDDAMTGRNKTGMEMKQRNQGQARVKRGVSMNAQGTNLKFKCVTCNYKFH